MLQPSIRLAGLGPGPLEVRLAPMCSVCGSYLSRKRPLLHALAAAAFILAAPATDQTILLGTPFLLLGIAIRTWALGYVAKNTALCTSGPYAWVRHPLYAGSMVMAAGYCVMLNSPELALVAALLTACVYGVAIRREEEGLERTFPGAYEAYRERVPALAPAPWRRRGAASTAPGGFSWQRAVHNRAVRGALLALVAASLFDAKEDTIEAIWHYEPALNGLLAHILGLH